MPTLKLFGLCFSRGGAVIPEAASAAASGGSRILSVPERAQLAYPGGDGWCSPACVTMVLAYWAEILKRPELNRDVPEVAAGVFDKNWPGTGNWPFNTAFAGQLAGMRALVTRLRDVAELENLIAAGVPPIVSVAFDFLNGKAVDQGSGHLVVCVVANEGGDMVLNDPWTFGNKAGVVRRTVSRRDFQKAWARSRQTVYLILPATWPLPRNALGHW